MVEDTSMEDLMEGHMGNPTDDRFIVPATVTATADSMVDAANLRME